eukprot:CAMPEP_0169133104 /NCGR_PEP_ID=MMETSP1015-20121227/39133_1 /TAXON_ID=342587 /ORGANISM="Karlodinium micrum, Strain CCMP2283" /LENGTH=153 /DNA_ID=CAMNT_0009197471 /DNA_START=62 /DNA_END=520 /DNA_ORIENTATION=+
MQFARELSVCIFVFARLYSSDASSLRYASAPDVASEVQREMQQNIQIHDGFLAQEGQDAQTVSAVRADHDLSQLQLKTGGKWFVALDKDLKTKMLVESVPQRMALASGIKDPCSGITCGALECPAGFSVTEVEGHCCPYCVNPDVKVEAAITG